MVLQSGVQLREKWDTGVGTSAPGLVGSGTTKAKLVIASSRLAQVGEATRQVEDDGPRRRCGRRLRRGHWAPVS